MDVLVIDVLVNAIRKERERADAYDADDAIMAGDG